MESCYGGLAVFMVLMNLIAMQAITTDKPFKDC